LNHRRLVCPCDRSTTVVWVGGFLGSLALALLGDCRRVLRILALPLNSGDLLAGAELVRPELAKVFEEGSGDGCVGEDVLVEASDIFAHVADLLGELSDRSGAHAGEDEEAGEPELCDQWQR
jgi:hypothetical protein